MIRGMEMTDKKHFLPCEAIRKILVRSQGERGEGCHSLKECAQRFGAERQDVWNPAGGRVPRSFAGAVRSIEDVRLVIVLAEPSKPEEKTGAVREPFDPQASADEKLAQAAWYSFSKLMDPARYGGTEYHRNLSRFVADCFWQDDGTSLVFEEQMARAWITASVLCSVPTKAVDKVPEDVVKCCAENYLLRELALFSRQKPVLVAMGKTTSCV